jgi:phosphoribosylamine--glycine ligase
MKVLVIGNGGREHALAWKLKQSPRVSEVIVAPGNAGTANERGVRNAVVAVTDIDGLLNLARAENIGLTVVGPEVPLVAGVVDRFRAAGLRCFGPRANAAQLEGSKAFAKDFLERHGIPTAHYAVFTETGPALDYVREKGAPIVIKADGLAAGKGVVVAMTLAEAETAINDMLGDKAFGDASSRVVVEEFLDGEEASFIVVSDGKHALPMASSQDHKRRDDHDLGPNTGGMGAYSPAGMAADGAPFVGFLYAGLMIDAQGAPKVIEFNVRFGDPETQPIMLRLQSDLVDLIDAALDGRLANVEARWDPRPSIGVVLAAGGYPGKVRAGDAISGHDIDFGPDVKVFHAGTGIDAQGQVITSGGRVLTVCALGENIETARAKAYAAIEKISFADMFHRSDIAYRALQR